MSDTRKVQVVVCVENTIIDKTMVDAVKADLEDLGWSRPKKEMPGISSPNTYLFYDVEYVWNIRGYWERA